VIDTIALEAPNRGHAIESAIIECLDDQMDLVAVSTHSLEEMRGVTGSPLA
jgi:hypothetical protein